jgi:hypothetical protein
LRPRGGGASGSTLIALRDCRTGRPDAVVSSPRRAGTSAVVRTVSIAYVLLIVGGIALFLVIGLTVD